MYVQVVDFCISRGPPTVPLTQILRNKICVRRVSLYLPAPHIWSVTPSYNHNVLMPDFMIKSDQVQFLQNKLKKIIIDGPKQILIFLTPQQAHARQAKGMNGLSGSAEDESLR